MSSEYFAQYSVIMRNLPLHLTNLRHYSSQEGFKESLRDCLVDGRKGEGKQLSLLGLEDEIREGK